MRIHIWGTDFRREAARLMQKLYLAPEQRKDFLESSRRLGFDHLVYLATCNRIEFFTTAKDPFIDLRPQWVSLLNQFGLKSSDYYLGYHFEGKAALRHLLRVASSLESMVVGEPQILGQLKDALNESKNCNPSLDLALEKAFRLSFETAKKTRTDTSIGAKSVSVASLAILHLKAREAEFPLKRVVVIGRSPINLAIIQWWLKNKSGIPITWVNRNKEILNNYPESAQCDLLSLESFLQRPFSFSHFFTATASSEPLFKMEFFEKAIGNQKALVFDFAEPSDLSPSAHEFKPITLVRLWDLQEEAKANAELRVKEVDKAESIIETALKNYCLQQRQAPFLRDFNTVEPAYLEELDKSFVHIESELSSENQTKVKHWARSLVKRNLHISRLHLRSVLEKVADPAETSVV